MRAELFGLEGEAVWRSRYRHRGMKCVEKGRPTFKDSLQGLVKHID